MTKLILKQAQSMEFAVTGRRDIDLWDDVDTPEDEEWARLVNEALNPPVVSKEYSKDSALVAYMLPITIGSKLYGKVIFPDDSEILPFNEYHITLKYIGDTSSKLKIAMVEQEIKDFAKQHPPITITIPGTLGRFTNVEDGTQDAVYLKVESQALQALRGALCDKLHDIPGMIKEDYSEFTPHITLAYVPAGAKLRGVSTSLTLVTTQLDSIDLRVGDDMKSFPLTGNIKKKHILRFKGGPGSGHHGHVGRPGKRGGSSSNPYVTVYHGTLTERIDGIVKDGIKLGKSWHGRPPSVYYLTSKAEAKRLATLFVMAESFAIFEARVPKQVLKDAELDVHANIDFNTKTSYRIAQSIQAEWLYAVDIYAKYDKHDKPTPHSYNTVRVEQLQHRVLKEMQEDYQTVYVIVAFDNKSDVKQV